MAGKIRLYIYNDVMNLWIKSYHPNPSFQTFSSVKGLLNTSTQTAAITNVALSSASSNIDSLHTSWAKRKWLEFRVLSSLSRQKKDQCEKTRIYCLCGIGAYSSQTNSTDTFSTQSSRFSCLHTNSKLSEPLRALTEHLVNCYGDLFVLLLSLRSSESSDVRF